MKFSLALPRQAQSIPVMRRVLGDALRGLGVSDDCVADILVATSEACTNVIRHAGVTANYEVIGCIDENNCVLKIVDGGKGLPGTSELRSRGRQDRDRDRDRNRDRDRDRDRNRDRDRDRDRDRRELSETGRGIKIMRALVDDVTFDSTPDMGTVVYLLKRLTWSDEAPLRLLEHELVRSAG